MAKRPIKFRAWDGKKMLFTDKGQFYLMNNGTIDIPSSTGHEFYNKNYPVMQFTGLHDRNGKEIYEGDILCNEEYDAWEWRGVVKFSHGVFGAEWLSNVESQSMVGSWGQKHNLRKLDDDILERQVVVGNIYENPELLTQQTP